MSTSILPTDCQNVDKMAENVDMHLTQPENPAGARCPRGGLVIANINKVT
jgi:hypothetical protein